MSLISTRIRDDVVIVDFLSSELMDESEAQEIGQSLAELVDNGADKLLLSLANVDFIASALVGQLFVLNQKCRAKRSSLKLCSVPDAVREIFSIVRLEEFIPVHEDEAAALESFGPTESSQDESRLASKTEQYRNAAASGDAYAQYKLSLCYEEGRGVEQDEEAAQQWLEKAARQGHIGAQYRMGQAYAFGIRVPQNYDKAIGWYQPAAERGHVDAQYAMGMSCRYGIGVEEDLEQARRWYGLAAKQGHSKAEEALQEMDDAE